MAAFIAYLEKEVPWWQMPPFIFKSTGILIVVAMGMWMTTSLILGIFGLSISTKNVADVSDITFTTFFTVGMLAFLIEEVMFRAPLFIPAWFHQDRIVVAALAVSSVIFGYMHGDATNIPIQGFSGAILAVVFLKCGGMQRKFFKALFASTMTHAAFDFCLILPTMVANL